MMSMSREEIIRIVDRAMAQGNDFVDNFLITNRAIQSAEQAPPVNSAWNITSNRRVIGRLVILVKRCLRKLLGGYFAYLADQINHINMLQNNAIRSLAQTVEEMHNQILETQKSIIQKQNELQEQLEVQLQTQRDYIQRSEQRMEAVEAGLHNTETRILATEKTAVDLANSYSEMKNSIIQKQNKLQEQLEVQLQAQKDYIQRLKQQMETVEAGLHNTETRILATEKTAVDLADSYNEMNKCVTGLKDKFTRTEQAGMFAPKSDMDKLFPYVAFEDRYRGAEKSISDWQTVYLKYFKNRENVLDIGCGRGEFLTLLKKDHVKAKGIDLSDEMIEKCKEQGLDVEKADMFDYLEQLGDGALDGVFCSQVVEHLSTQQLLRLVQLLNKKVRIGSPVVIETINPGNIVSASNGFYMDLSHIRPVHSSTLSFLMEVNGFPLQEMLYLHPETEKEVPSLNLPEAAEFNEKMKNVNQVLFGARDYGLVAFRQ